MNYYQIETAAYDYELPQEQIANYPLSKRDDSRLLIYKNGNITDSHFHTLPEHLDEGLLIVNDTRVIEARILFQKSTGARIEIFCLEPYQQSLESALQSENFSEWQCMIGGASKWKPGQILMKEIFIHGTPVLLQARYLEKVADSFRIHFSWKPGNIPFSEVLHTAGNMPLPPYIKRETVETDKERYQTVFSRHEGSVAAPTAALHFTEEIFQRLEEKNIHVEKITLHVGAGTFKPVKTSHIGDHVMHQEPFSITKSSLQHIRNADRVIAVGTTSLRTLESIYWMGIKILKGDPSPFVLSQWEAYELHEKYGSASVKNSLDALLNWMESNDTECVQGNTSLLIVPGYSFRIPHALVTNFHQPQSTLLLLVSAFIGEDWRRVYAYALENGFRFLSYGDSSLLWRKD